MFLEGLSGISSRVAATNTGQIDAGLSGSSRRFVLTVAAARKPRKSRP
jgi:hypothetical protein